jgi:hypothetical protein
MECPFGLVRVLSKLLVHVLDCHPIESRWHSFVRHAGTIPGKWGRQDDYLCLWSYRVTPWMRGNRSRGAETSSFANERPLESIHMASGKTAWELAILSGDGICALVWHLEMHKQIC